MVGEIGAQSGKRAITLYETTDAGLDALRRWVQHFPGQDQVVIKHPVILRTWLARGEDPEHIVDTSIGTSRPPGRGWTRRCGRGSGHVNSASPKIRTSASHSPSWTTRSAACTPSFVRSSTLSIFLGDFKHFAQVCPASCKPRKYVIGR